MTLDELKNKARGEPMQTQDGTYQSIAELIGLAKDYEEYADWYKLDVVPGWEYYDFEPKRIEDENAEY